MSESERIELAGIPLHLMAGRGVWFGDEETLLIADTHFGKEATFRRHHIPVPVGTTDGTLAAITQMIEQTAARRLIILGDMFHARSSLSSDVCLSLETFLQQHRSIEIVLVRGNHDDHVGPLPPHWPIETVNQFRMGPIALAHHPGEVPQESELLICGHLHPALRLETLLDSAGVLPCFWYSRRRLVIPAIGEFTGTHRVKPKPKDRVWVVVDDQVIEHRVTMARRAVD